MHWRCSDFRDGIEEILQEQKIDLDDFAVRETISFSHPEWSDLKNRSAEFEVVRWKPGAIPFLAAGIQRAMSAF